MYKWSESSNASNRHQIPALLKKKKKKEGGKREIIANRERYEFARTSF